MGQLVCHKMLVEFSCRRPRRKWTSHHFHLLCQKRVYILFTVNICIFFKMKLIWSCFWQKDLGGFILLGLQVFYTEEWLQSVRLHSSSSSSPWGVSAPLLWNLGQWPFWEGEFGYDHFFQEEGEACWWWLNSKDLEAEDMGRNGGIWDGGGWWNEGGNGDRKRRSVGEKATQ